jgi:hypothetical protein
LYSFTDTTNTMMKSTLITALRSFFKTCYCWLFFFVIYVGRPRSECKSPGLGTVSCRFCYYKICVRLSPVTDAAQCLWIMWTFQATIYFRKSSHDQSVYQSRDRKWTWRGRPPVTLQNSGIRDVGQTHRYS